MSEQIMSEQVMPEQERPGQVMFRSYGLFWRRDRIFWGRGEHLKGQVVDEATGKTKTKSQEIDFKDQIGIYALYDNFELVYVGQVGANTDENKGRTLLDRLKDHKDGRNSERWDRFSWFGLRGVTQTGELKKLRGPLRVTRGQILKQFEGVMIALSEPKLNLQRGHWKGHATQYSQWYDPDELDRQAKQKKERKGMK